MVYPRACALSEVVWSPKESRDYDDFRQRMQVHMKRLDVWGVNYAKHIQNKD
jgi:hexosaminidase